MQDVSVTFDEEYKVRVLAADKFKQTQTLEQECKAFVTRTYYQRGSHAVDAGMSMC